MQPPLPTLKAVLFDLDGTLIHSIDHIVDCWQHAARTCLGRELSREEILPTLGRNLFDCLDEMAPGHSAELYAVYKAHQHITHDSTVTLVPGTRETLTRLKEAGLLLGLVTSKGIPVAMRGLNLFDLTPFFDTLVTIEDTRRHKPYPDPLLAASERLRTPPFQMIYIGDAAVDIQAGKAAGMSTAWVTWGAGTLGDLGADRPDYVFERLEEVLALLPAELARRVSPWIIIWEQCHQTRYRASYAGVVGNIMTKCL